MNFSIRHFTQNGLELIHLIDEKSGTRISVLPGYGATLQGFEVKGRDGLPFDVVDHYADAAELKKEMSHSFKGPKLSPFPCRIPDGVYQFDGKEYHLQHLFSDGTAIHGLLYNRSFAIVEENAGEGGVTVAMECSYNKEDSGYPFQYDCHVRYELHPGNMLEVTTTVTNAGQEVMPLADGWHPYWRLGGNGNDWLVQFHSEAMVEFDQRLVPTGRLTQYGLFAAARPLGDTFLDNCFVLKPELVSAACELYNPYNGLRVSFYPDSSYPYLQIYTPPSRKSIAVENLSGAPDCFNNKMGLVLLAPGHSQIFTVKYKVSVE